MKETTKYRLIFYSGLVAITASLGWATGAALSYEKRELAAQEESQKQESLRLALWRMDSSLLTLLAQESSRPYSTDLTNSEPSGIPPELIDCRFQLDGSGKIGSIAFPPKKSMPVVQNMASADFEKQLVAQLLSKLDSTPAKSAQTVSPAQQQDETDYDEMTMQIDQQQAPQQKSSKEYSYRANTAWQAQNMQQQLFQGDFSQGNLLPVWVAFQKEGTKLVLTRKIESKSKKIVQALMIDWGAFERWLLEGVRDLFPEAKLQPILSENGIDPAKRLAAIPAYLEPGPARESAMPHWTPLRMSLIVAWAAVIAALLSASFVLRSAIDLGERRGRFVSAVTHELRTPLTTFRMYSEMLAENMVTDPNTRRDYLETLKQESGRLSRIVENVLLYARVEGRRASKKLEEKKLSEILAAILPRLEERAKSAGMQLVVENAGDKNPNLSTDVQILEQILFNLVDNSCKYAASASNRNLHLKVNTSESDLELLFWDHGPGIPRGEEERIFTPFERSSREKESNTPGIGLGLALSRSLARELGGELSLRRDSQSDACFGLTLPRLSG